MSNQPARRIIPHPCAQMTFFVPGLLCGVRIQSMSEPLSMSRTRPPYVKAADCLLTECEHVLDYMLA